jgi:hypothetical protein
VPFHLVGMLRGRNPVTSPNQNPVITGLQFATSKTAGTNKEQSFSNCIVLPVSPSCVFKRCLLRSTISRAPRQGKTRTSRPHNKRPHQRKTPTTQNLRLGKTRTKKDPHKARPAQVLAARIHERKRANMRLNIKSRSCKGTQIVSKWWLGRFLADFLPGIWLPNGV